MDHRKFHLNILLKKLCGDCTINLSEFIYDERTDYVSISHSMK